MAEQLETFVVSESAPDPITVGVERVPLVIVNGVPTSWQTNIAILVPKVRVTETRGYTSKPDVPGNSSTVLTNGNFHFESSKIAYEARRINEADMWRLIRTETIQALYVNDRYIAGNISF